MQKRCEHCSKEFSIKPYRAKTARFCSKACSDSFKQIIINCAKCGVSVVRKRKDKDTAKFCSRKCQGEWDSVHRTGKNARRYTNGNCVEYDPVKCRNCGQEFQQLRKHLVRGYGDICSSECRAAIQSVWQIENSVVRKAKIGVICEICGKAEEKIPSFARQRRFCSKSCRAAWQRIRMKGENHPLWNGGVSELRSRLSVTKEYKEWRQAVFTRDRFACQRCGDARGGNLHAHHLKMVSTHPEFVFDVSNGQTLCSPCHIEVHKTMPHVNGEGRIAELFNKDR